MRRPTVSQNADKLVRSVLGEYLIEHHDCNQKIATPLTKIARVIDVASEETRFKVILAAMRKLVRLGVYVEWDDVSERLVASFLVDEVDLIEIQRRLN